MSSNRSQPSSTKTISKFKQKLKLTRRPFLNSKGLWLSSRQELVIWNSWKIKRNRRKSNWSNSLPNEESLFYPGSQLHSSAHQLEGLERSNSKRLTLLLFTRNTSSTQSRSWRRYLSSRPKQGSCVLGYYWLESSELIVRRLSTSKPSKQWRPCVTKRTVLEISSS